MLHLQLKIFPPSYSIIYIRSRASNCNAILYEQNQQSKDNIIRKTAEDIYKPKMSLGRS